ncbi:hypothetical protein RE428_11280 [Marinobacter nanhaiticus D15-8W]|uniref:DUF3828 domain-containing protein n=1 Tax=Marinobacter nanhaiticus D15-8W TaxID=626887 RepID=N6WVB6_9GAMM|nr:hypothetical protein [Marinobacter nanhaiticus]ENO12763.1 hypothetical protein J057_15235 [Marinobacter nanhaiticus D15-8W]BES70110.1 hypothetical protein RE428_11280 [Marinobacter nanhaiticus D15-8W]
MTTQYLLFPLIAVTFLLSACSGPNTPQEVSEAFWQSMLEGDAGSANTYSTLVDDAASDSYEQDWRGVGVDWGRVVIDGHQASVETTLRGLKGQSEPREVTTYLVKKDDQWLVDYYRTGDALDRGPLFGDVLNKLGRLGEELQARRSQQSSEMVREIERLNDDLEQKAEQANEHFSSLLQEYAEALEHHLDAFSRSINEALQNHPAAPPEDRRRLNQAVLRLDVQRDNLDTPDLRSVARSSQTAVQTQLELAQLSDEFAGYKAEWKQRVAKMEEGLADLLQRARQPTG